MSGALGLSLSSRASAHWNPLLFGWNLGFMWGSAAGFQVSPFGQHLCSWLMANTCEFREGSGERLCHDLLNRWQTSQTSPFRCPGHHSSFSCCQTFFSTLNEPLLLLQLAKSFMFFLFSRCQFYWCIQYIVKCDAGIPRKVNLWLFMG